MLYLHSLLHRLYAVVIDCVFSVHLMYISGNYHIYLSGNFRCVKILKYSANSETNVQISFTAVMGKLAFELTRESSRSSFPAYVPADIYSLCSWNEGQADEDNVPLQKICQPKHTPTCLKLTVACKNSTKVLNFV